MLLPVSIDLAHGSVSQIVINDPHSLLISLRSQKKEVHAPTRYSRSPPSKRRTRADPGTDLQPGYHFLGLARNPRIELIGAELDDLVTFRTHHRIAREPSFTDKDSFFLISCYSSNILDELRLNKSFA